MNTDSYFSIEATDGLARATSLKLSGQNIPTPCFMPVGTLGVVKTQSSQDLKNLGFKLMLSNTYHLWIRPGVELLQKMGGLKQLMNWDGALLTDSGGFQIFSLGHLRQIDDKGVIFQSHLNGDRLELTPEKAALIQQAIGSDIAMVLDECPALPSTSQKLEEAVMRSALWAKRFFDVPRLKDQKIFGINQGGLDPSLRLQSLEFNLSVPVDGLAVGGLSVGETLEERHSVLKTLSPYLPQNLPHYLMGVGTPLDILEAIGQGIDLFDCVLPTRNGRNGGFFTDEGLLNIKNQKFQADPSPISENCLCDCCRHYSRAYLRHLFQIKEILGCRLATIHNLYYYHQLMNSCRRAILEKRFASFAQELKRRWNGAYSKVEEAEC